MIPFVLKILVSIPYNDSLAVADSLLAHRQETIRVGQKALHASPLLTPRRSECTMKLFYLGMHIEFVMDVVRHRSKIPQVWSSLALDSTSFLTPHIFSRYELTLQIFSINEERFEHVSHTLIFDSILFWGFPPCSVMGHPSACLSCFPH